MTNSAFGTVRHALALLLICGALAFYVMLVIGEVNLARQDLHNGYDEAARNDFLWAFVAIPLPAILGLAGAMRLTNNRMVGTVVGASIVVTLCTLRVLIAAGNLGAVQ